MVVFVGGGGVVVTNAHYNDLLKHWSLSTFIYRRGAVIIIPIYGHRGGRLPLKVVLFFEKLQKIRSQLWHSYIHICSSILKVCVFWNVLQLVTLSVSQLIRPWVRDWRINAVSNYLSCLLYKSDQCHMVPTCLIQCIYAYVNGIILTRVYT